MGIFNFFNTKNGTDKPKVFTPAAEGFKLSVSDFELATHESEVINVKISADFQELFADYVIDNAKKTGDKIKTDTYIAKIMLWEQPAELYIPGLNPENLGYINNKLNWISQNKRPLDLKIARDLLELKNTNWLAENQAALTEESFLNSICITAIDFTDSPGIKLVYSADELFGGHDITLEMNRKNEIIKVGI